MVTCNAELKLQPVREVGRVTVVLSQSKDGSQGDLTIRKEGDISAIARVVVFGRNPGFDGPEGPEPPSEFQWAEFSEERLQQLNLR